MTWKYDLALALLQYTLGIYFLVSGCRKCWSPTIHPRIEALFQRLGLTRVQLYLVTYGQVLGGAALLLGVAVQLAAALLIPIMVGALYLFVWPNIKEKVKDEGRLGYITNLTCNGELYMLIGLVMLVLLGPTRWTLL